MLSNHVSGYKGGLGDDARRPRIAPHEGKPLVRARL